MDTWHQVSDCLDGKLLGALKIERCSASVGTGKADAAQLSDFVGASAPAEPKFAVIAGGRAALHALPRRPGMPPARVARLHLVTVDGVRVDHSAASR